MEITVPQLVSISGMPQARAEKYIEGLNKTLKDYCIDTPVMACMFLAQILHESGAFRYMTELASGSAYEGRKDLGNVNPGDGPKYKGRGVIQTTGRDNYDKLGKAFGQDFINNPELLAEPPYCVLSGGWFWNNHKLSDIAKAGTEEAFKKVTKVINGGYNGYDNGPGSRVYYWEKAKSVLMH